uniref:Uncharacterized protein n=1 Tax=Rhizophora mucronata TaxID=61149 RepID=A0A2P2IMP1_RHIMU
MGSGIATALIVSNIYVVLKEINSEYLQKGIKTIEGGHMLLRLTIKLLILRIYTSLCVCSM